jgi:hypothetical protein
MMTTASSLSFTLHPRLEELAPFESEWDALRGDDNPFTRFQYLWAMEASQSACPTTGWQPLHAALWQTDEAGNKRLAAACPLYLKSHSYGEYVFDWAWAQAYEQHGLAYYPKLVAAVPFTPVPGERLFAQNEEMRRTLLDHIVRFAERERLSGLHLLFISDKEQTPCSDEGLMLRTGVQFHWHNQSWNSFADFLASLKREKRKKIQQEQRKVEEADIAFRIREGTQISSQDWDFFYRCYTQNYLEHGNAPYLSRAFFQMMQDRMPENWLLFTAYHRPSEQAIACSLIALNQRRSVAYGRYWGALARVSGLHFDACYYQPLRWCIENKIQRFEGGAQGEHKMARALMPSPTRSAHWIAHPQFAHAIGDFLEHEQAGMLEYENHLHHRSPFKAQAGFE